MNIAIASYSHLNMARVWFDIMAWMQISVKLWASERSNKLRLYALPYFPQYNPMNSAAEMITFKFAFCCCKEGTIFSMNIYFHSPPTPQSPRNAGAYQAISTYFCFPLISPSLKSTVAHRTPQQTPRASRQQLQFLWANGTNRHRGVFKGKKPHWPFPSREEKRLAKIN